MDAETRDLLDSIEARKQARADEMASLRAAVLVAAEMLITDWDHAKGSLDVTAIEPLREAMAAHDACMKERCK